MLLLFFVDMFRIGSGKNLELYCFVFLLYCQVHLLFCRPSEISNAAQLRKDLLKDYDKNVRPVVHHDTSTPFKFGITPIYIQEVNEDLQRFVLDVWLMMTWHDEYLTWEPEDYGGIKTLHTTGLDIWRPEHSVYNSYSADNIYERQDTNVIIWYNGTVMQIPPATIYTLCDMRKGSKEQTCIVKFGQWTYSAFVVDMTIYEQPVKITNFANTNPYWEMKSATVHMNTTYYPCCPEPYTSITYTFHLKRRSEGALSDCEPSVVAILLCLAMFWMPFDSRKKMIMGCFALLIQTICFLYLALATKVQSRVSSAVSHIKALMVVMLSAVLLEIIVFNVRRIIHRPPPRPVIDLLSGIAGKILLITPFHSQTKSKSEADAEENNKADNSPSKLQLTTEEQWHMIAMASDRLLFIIYSIIFLIVRNVS